MRKFLYLIPLLFMPAMAGASHNLVDAAYSLEARAERVHAQVAYLPGNWQLKQEARQFVLASERLARQVRRGAPPRRILRTLRRLNGEFYDLKYAASQAHLRYKKRKRLRRSLAKLSRSLTQVEYALDSQWRRAGKRVRYGYRNAYYDDDSSDDRRGRRYRD